MRRVYSEAKRSRKDVTEPDLVVVAWMPGGRDDDWTCLPGLIYARTGTYESWYPRAHDSESEVIRAAIRIFDDTEGALRAQYEQEEADELAGTD